MSPKLLAIIPILTLTLTTNAQQASPQPKGYYRTPSISHNTIVFTAEGDLWKYDLTTHITARLTSHEGLETNPVIAPDGRNVAFTGQYEGPNEVYLMPLDGGVPKRLTYALDGGSRPAAWMPNGKLLYATSAYSTYPIPQPK